jgi:hypothetical protein
MLPMRLTLDPRAIGELRLRVSLRASLRVAPKCYSEFPGVAQRASSALFLPR